MRIKEFETLYMVKQPQWLQTFANIFMSMCGISIFLLIFMPWQQTSMGSGFVTALSPENRVQDLHAPVSGLIKKWYVQDGSIVKKGDPLVEVVDQDPNYIERLEKERDSMLAQYNAARIAAETALMNKDRQNELFKLGLSAKTKEEKALIKYKELLAKEAQAAAKLAKAEVKLSQQQNQLIQAPRDGIVLRVKHGTGAVVVKEGDYLLTFVPSTVKPAVEVFVAGNDLPLVYPGRHVRLQFEGWPAVQFSGWPQVAIGTFGGEVVTVDPSVHKNGKFRVLVAPAKDEKWPDLAYLRQGTRAYGWILLDEVKLGYELWRQLNGFPPSMDENPYIEATKKEKKSSGKDKEKEKEKE